MLKVSIIISDKNHPVFLIVSEWISQQIDIDIELVNCVEQLSESGDFLFLVSCSEIVSHSVRARFKKCLVLHASDLPKGRGWSPHIWAVVNGSNNLTLSLLEAEDKVDTGDIWLKTLIPLDGTELFNEINEKLFKAELLLIEKAISEYLTIIPKKQDQSISSFYYTKRTPNDSQLDPNKTIEQQFNLLRVCDNERFPAFIDIHGQKYTVKLEKMIESGK
jgi:methionyl-tRNA formyltransferase